jgi:SET domain-containing protein
MPIPTRLPKWFDPRLHGGASRIHGRGLFVRAPVRAGEILMRWGGVLLAVADYDPVLYRPASTTHYDEGRCLATPAGEPASLDELLNHACDPNLWLIDEVTVVARRAIAAGDEVTGDFATWEDSAHVLTSDCACGSALCRRRITGRDFRIPALQARYRGHFLPYLDRAIAALREGGAENGASA